MAEVGFLVVGLFVVVLVVAVDVVMVVGVVVVLVVVVAGISESVRPQWEVPVSLEGRLGVTEGVRTLVNLRLGTAPAPARDLETTTTS